MSLGIFLEGIPHLVIKYGDGAAEAVTASVLIQ